ncbi:MAG: division/cell wall cluster transcriptional repressor MraZ [Deltaproteobacteria bacterium]|nr:division/cell wall cluster transcriptional repressor MraZ [Deltaproteobacteria bacterium]MBI5810414.1 division/cell wall cluster transcriptional repressor MraZ [Deltaproteobacteria bacterium]
MFRGRFEHTIDSKGRLSIPSRFRETLNERYDARLVVTTYDGCLIAYPHAEWQRLEERISTLPEFRRDTRAFLRFFYSSAMDCSIDSLGRMLIPQVLRDYAKLEKDVVLIGALKIVEIWSKDVWEKATLSASPDDIAGTLERLGL